MNDCCSTEPDALARLRARQRRVLVAVLVVNASLFVVEFAAGLLADSTALLADSLDMLGDAIAYGFSLLVLHRSLAWRARAAFMKGSIMAVFGVAVLVEAVLRLRAGIPPLVPAMAIVGVIALIGNAFCFWLLWRHREDDVNLRSTWLCSRNDLIANGAVLGATGLVEVTASLWPDFIVGVGIAILFLRTAMQVLRESVAEMARARGRVVEHVG